MKKIVLLYLLLLSNTLVVAQGFTVQNFSADIYLNKTGYFDVTENYEVEFSEAKHGIFREIITRYDFQDESGKASKREIYISDIEVPGHHFNTNQIFGKQFNDRLSIRIGDKNKLVNGRQQYQIRYRVKNAIIFTDSLAQLYWNVKPAEWPVIFEKVNFTIHTPDSIQLSPENCFVYSGYTGNTQLSEHFDYTCDGNNFLARSKEAQSSYPGESVTVLIKLPKAAIAGTDFAPPFWARYGWLGMLGLIFISVFTYIKIRLRRNKVVAVTSYYPPENIDPAMAGVLIDNTADFRDISCLLPYWATKGIIRMEEIQKGDRSLSGDLRLIKLKELQEDAAGYEFSLFSKIFTGKDEVPTSTLRGVYSEPWQLLRQKSRQFYTSSGCGIKVIVLVLSWLWAFFSISFFPLCVRSYVDIESVRFILILIGNFIFFTFIFPFAFAYISNKLRSKNQKGRSIMPELTGFYQFVKMAEADRIKTLLETDPLYFEKTMPYAVAFNLLDEWAAKFQNLLTQAPSWYSSSSGTRFTMNNFAHSFSQSMSVAKTSMVTSPSSGSSSSHSSSGGSSGGGFGGGGGGSW